MTSRISVKANPSQTIRRAPAPTADSPISSELLRRAVENPASANPATILQLQRMHGNQFVSRIMRKQMPDIQACSDCGDEQTIHTMRADNAAESSQHGPGCSCGGCGRL